MSWTTRAARASIRGSCSPPTPWWPRSACRLPSRLPSRGCTPCASRRRFAGRWPRSEQGVNPLRSPLPCERSGAFETGPAQAPLLGFVAEQRLDRGRPLAGLDEAGGVPTRLRERARVRGEDGRAGRHRLEHRQAEALVERRQDERCCSGVQAGKRLVVDVAEEGERFEAGLACELRAGAAGDDDVDAEPPGRR